MAYEHDEPMKDHFNVNGPLIWLDDKGEADGHFDAFSYIELCREHYDKVGIGAGLRGHADAETPGGSPPPAAI